MHLELSGGLATMEHIAGGLAPIPQKQEVLLHRGDHQTFFDSLSVRLTLISELVLRGSHLGDVKTAGPGLCCPLVS